MFILPPLPYAYSALEPAISERTLTFHHDKHHKAYVDKTNQLAAEQGLANRSLEEVVRTASGPLLNNAGQAWNHAFYWESMTPDYTPPSPDLAALREAFIKEAAGHFASGWAWIVADGGRPTVISTHDGDCALRHAGTPLIVCDVWEHAYYLDRQNDRKAYLEAWWDRCANWRFAEKQIRASRGDGERFAYPAPEDVSAQKRSA